MKNLMPFIIIIVLFIIIAYAINISYQYRLKKRLLEFGPPDDNILRFLGLLASAGTEALKWGLLFFFGGLGLIVNYYLPDGSDLSPLPYGVESVFLALGFLSYYLLVKKQKNENNF
jgi:hypothetical protein